jgi:hypothetical protein
MGMIAAAAKEPDGCMISAIINLVCPQCGGGMMEFRCLGRCSRDWRPEWEWASHAFSRSKAQRHQRLPGGSRR